MRKSFELLDWMKEHFKGDGGKPSVLYKFTNGLKEQGGTVSVDAGNGVSVNEHTGMLEVPIGEHLSYTSQGIDAKEGDTAQKGVVQLTDAIEAHADHTTAATPAAVKEYVDANVVIGGGEGKTYTFQEPLAEHLGAVSVADASKSAKGVVKLASEMTDVSNPPTAADVKKYVDANSNGSSYTFESPLSESQGRVTVAKADEQNLGVVKLTHTVSHGEHSNEAVSPDGVAAYVDAKVAGAGGFSIVKAVGSNPDFALSSGDMIKSGNTLYGVLVFTCVKSTALVTEIASLPATLTRSVEVVLTRASNNVLQYTATATGSGTVKFTSERSLQQGTYVAVIAAQTN